MSDGYDGVREISRALGDLMSLGVSLVRAGFRQGAKINAHHAEQRARQQAATQQKEWRGMVERQKVRGEAGNASYEEAAEALRGAGGRPNPLDQRKF